MTNKCDFQSAAEAYANEDYERAFTSMLICGESHHPTACFLLALMFLNGEGVGKNEAEYHFWLRQFESLAHSGDADAQWQLSSKYRWGNHFQLDIKKANFWLLASAKNGNLDAAFHLSQYLEVGDFGLKANLEEARIWFQRALEGDYPEAIYREALKHYTDGFPNDVGLELLRKAAATGFSAAAEALLQLQRQKREWI